MVLYLGIEVDKVRVLFLNPPQLLRLIVGAHIVKLPMDLLADRNQERKLFFAAVVRTDVATNNKNRHKLQIVRKHAEGLLVEGWS